MDDLMNMLNCNVNQAVLPRVPSQLIRLALRDLKKIEADPRITVDMESWMAVDEPGSCMACLAGGVMIKTLHIPMDKDHWPDDYHGNRDQLHALDCFRSAQLRQAFYWLEIKPTSLKEWSDVNGIEAWLDKAFISYEEDPVKFRSWMHQLANKLEAAGF